MKEIKINLKDQVQVHGQKQVESKKVFLGSIRKIPGHTLFEFNLDTYELQKAEIKVDVIVNSSTEYKTRTSVIKKENCIYIQALNLKNARKKILKHFNIKP